MYSIQRQNTAAIMIWVSLVLVAAGARADDREPVLQLEGQGPLSYVTSLVFSPDGQTLYAGGFDKVVRVWRLDPQSGRFQLDERAALRVPIGPGLNGAINALALSDDGQWLAIGGRGTFRGASGFRDRGRIVNSSAMTQQMRADQGTVYVFNVNTRRAFPIRGHYGEVLALSFIPQTGEQPQLVTVGRDWAEGQFTATLRLWNILEQRYLGGKVLSVPDQRPQLAAWRDSQRQVQVGVAWGDGKLRLWNIGNDQLLTADAGSALNNTIAYQSEPYMIIGNADRNGGRLERWYHDPARGLQADGRWRSLLTSRTSGIHIPRSLALVSARGDGRWTQAATVSVELQNGQPRQYHLQLVSLSSGQLAAQVPLWRVDDQPRAPVLATSPRGSHVAISGSGDKEILVFELQSLLSGNQVRPQRLQSIGAEIGQVAFVQNGERLGLHLAGPSSTRAALQRGDLLFDFAAGLTTFQGQGWELARPPADGWSATQRGQRIELSRGGQPAISVEGPADSQITAYALNTAAEPPLLALATATPATGETTLVLHDATTGQAIRHCTAHSLPIRSLSFSPDGRLLVSAGSDYLICIWSVTDLSDVIGRHGAPPQIDIEAIQEGLRVTDANESPTVRAGDVLLGLVEGPDWVSAIDLVESFWQARPGDRLPVRVQRGSAVQAVQLPVRQGTDERKPLFSLFLTEQIGEGEREWIAWSPQGPYDASSRQAERYLGWHFNTDDPHAPASFAEAGQYRGDFFRRGLLPLLVERGELPDQLPPPPPLERPAMRLSLPGLASEIEVDLDGEGFVTAPQSEVRFEVLGVTPEQVARVELEVAIHQQDQWQAAGTFQPQADQSWSAQLPATLWQRGQHQLRAVLHTREESPQQFHQVFDLRYQPAAPTVEMPEDDRVVERPEYTFQADVKPAQQGERVSVQLVHRHQGQVIQQYDLDSGSIRQDMMLRPGANTLELIARNVDALAGFEQQEMARRQVRIVLDTSRVPPPLIKLTQIRPVDGELQESAAQEMLRGGLVAIASPAIDVQGTVDSPEPVQQLSWNLNGQQGVLPLAQARDEHVQTFTTQMPLQLRPGTQTLTLTAETPGDKRGETQIQLVYHPPLPQPVIIAPRDGLTLVEGRSPAAVTLEAQLKLPQAADLVYQAEIRVNGQVKAQPAVPRARDGQRTVRLQAEVPLEGGENRVQVVVTNQWGSEPQIATAVVHYRRPPRVTDMQTTEVGEHPLIGVQARVVSPLPLTRVEISGRRLEPEAVQPAGEGVWNIQAKDIPLTEGANSLYLFAWNQEGMCLDPGVVKNLMFMHTPPELAQVAILDPAGAAQWPEPVFPVRFRVSSPSPLRSVELLRNGQSLLRMDAAEIAQRDGQNVLEQSLNVDFEPGRNLLKVVAINDGGQQSDEVVMTYLEPPVRVVIDGLHSKGQADKLLKPESVLGHQLLFNGSAAQGQMILKGRVIWSQPNEDLEEKWSRVQVWVNGFQQPPQVLAPRQGDSQQRSFSVPVILNRPQGNYIEVRMPNLSAELNSQLAFEIDCAEPITEQRLHLLLVGIGVDDPEALERRALDALKAGPQTIRRHRFQTTAFTRGFVYGPIVGDYVDPGRVFYGLGAMRHNVQQLLERSPANDVVMVYYQGGEGVEQDGRFFLTTTVLGEGQPDIRYLESRSVDSQKLDQFIESTPGAHVLLFDVVRIRGDLAEPQSPANPHWMDESRAALMRYASLESTGTNRDPYLIMAMHGALRTAQQVNLATLDEQLAENIRLLPEMAPRMFYERYVPEALNGLTLTRP